MKKYIGVLLFSFLSIVVNAQDEKPTIVASASMISDMAKNIVGDYANVKMIVPIGGDPHRYQPSPSDAKLVQNADLILINGLTFEGWINELIENSGTKAETTTVSEGVDVISSIQYANSSDPHAWMDAENGIIYSQNILEGVIKLMPENEIVFRENFKQYKKELLKLDEEIKSLIQTIPEEQRVLITSHDAFQYYGEKYGLRLEAIMGISTEAEAQTSDIVRVTDAINNNLVPAIFIESTINPKLIQQIAKDNNVEVGGSLFADSLGKEGSGGETYIDMLRYNSKVIAAALSAPVKETSEEEESKSYLLYIIVGALVLGLLPLLLSKMKKS